MLAVHDVEKSFGGIRAVDGCSLTIEKRAIVGVIGPNSAGKTTLFKIISGFEKLDNGAIIFNGEHIEDTTSFEIARKGLIRTFQISKALTRLTVEENLLLAPQFQYGERIWNVWLRPKDVKRQEEENREKAHALLEFLGLLRLKDEYAGALSGGQKRLLEIARALMADPQMLLLDEPFAGVNPTQSMKILERLKELVKIPV
jgi:ABC-type branched-subunit amino acid transport system ATPase component